MDLASPFFYSLVRSVQFDERSGVRTLETLGAPGRGCRTVTLTPLAILRLAAWMRMAKWANQPHNASMFTLDRLLVASTYITVVPVRMVPSMRLDFGLAKGCVEQIVRSAVMRFRLSVCLIAFALSTLSLIADAAEWERGISLERALKAADIAAGFSKGRPDDYDVVKAKLTLSNHFHVDDEALTRNLKDMESLSPPKRFWLIVYRRWPPRLDDDLVVFIDANSGEPMKVYRTRSPAKSRN
jgi:hypothetical protein